MYTTIHRGITTMNKKAICIICKAVENISDLDTDDVNDEGVMCPNCFSLNSFRLKETKSKKDKSKTKR